METVTASNDQIKKQILTLSEGERASLLKWMIESERYSWDHEIERDFSESGPGEALLKEVKNDFRAGRCSKWE